MSDQEHIDWQQRYESGDTPWDSGQPSSRLLEVLRDHQIPSGRALELGCGTGASAIALAQRGFDVTAIDLAPLAIERARQQAAEAHVSVNWIVGDVLAPPDLPGPFDFVFDRGCYHCIRRDDPTAGPARLLKILQHHTSPGTRMLLLAGNADEQTEHGPPRVTAEEIRSDFESLFEIDELEPFRFEGAPDEPHYLAWSCLMTRREE